MRRQLGGASNSQCLQQEISVKASSRRSWSGGGGLAINVKKNTAGITSINTVDWSRWAAPDTLSLRVDMITKAQKSTCRRRRKKKEKKGEHGVRSTERDGTAGRGAPEAFSLHGGGWAGQRGKGRRERQGRDDVGALL